MRSTRGIHGGRLRACAAASVASAALACAAATPAAAVTNLYAAQQSSSAGLLLWQYAVAPSGSLSALAPSAIGFGAQDIAITPNGSFAYVTRSQGSDAGFIAPFARAADGRMTPAGVDVDGGTDPRGIIVNPQGTRVYYAVAGSQELRSRPIDAGGALGGATATATTGRSPRFLAMTPSGTSLYASAVVVGGAVVTGILQYDVDPATGTLTPKSPLFVAWPELGGPGVIARMTVSPDGRHLYAAAGDAGFGIAHFAIDASGALGGGSVLATPGDRSSTSVTAIAPNERFAWAPTTAPSGTTGLGKVGQFSRDPTSGALGPLVPPAVNYPANASFPARDAIASPDGASLYLGQDANVGEWAIAGDGTVALRANLAVGGTQNAGIVLRPSQAPVASFTATPAAAGQATTFDAGGSSDPDGTIARYDWDFGDGSSLANGGSAPSHVYADAGARTVTLTVTDADGTSTSQLWTGARMLRNGGPSAQTTRSVAIAPAPPPPPPPPPAAPTPKRGQSVIVTRVSGKVRVKVPGSKVYVDITTLTEIPLGSRIDARKGRVRLTAEVDAKTHKTQSSMFYEGIFVVGQTKGAKTITEAKLVGGTFAGCARRTTTRTIARGAVGGALGPAVAYAAKPKGKRSKRRVRRLWGKGEGDFRTAGRRSSATVRGTWWLVEDRCDGTYTRVKQGRVDVRDFRLKKTIKLRAGKRSLYLAKAP